MTTNEIIAAVCVLVLSGFAWTLYLMKNAPLDPSETNQFRYVEDVQPIGRRRKILDIIVPTLFVVIGLIIFAGLYNNLEL